MKWVDALNSCLSLSKLDFFIRVDDDMFLHPQCVKYMISMIEDKKKLLASYACRLYEDWTNKIGGYVRIYQSGIVKKMGGFKVSKLGKVDKKFSLVAKDCGFKVVKDLSVVGIHSCGSWEDQSRYRELWLKNNSSIYFDEPHIEQQKNYKKTLSEQYDLIKILLKINKKHSTSFGKFIGK